jgi:pyrroline-5-carboxylate reductase
LASFKLGIVGCGKMGEAILKGVLNSNFLDSKSILAYEIKEERREYIKNSYNISFANNVDELIKNSRYILISVKPQNISELLDEVKLSFNIRNNVVISIAAGVPTSFIEKKIGGKISVIRVMPNAPALINKCMSAISRGKFVDDKDLDFAINLIENLGDYVIIDEKYQNIATAISGSGPAYFFLIGKYLIESGVKRGLNGAVSEKLVVNTIIGAGEMMKQYNIGADGLIKMVASPGGTTERALNKFTEMNLKTVIDSAVESAEDRANELQNLFKNQNNKLKGE